MGIPQAQFAAEKVIHSFEDFPYGANPYGTLTRDAAGNLYGTTYQGGTADAGVVFKLDASGHYKVLHSFKGGTDGANPDALVIVGPTGNLYGTTNRGGTADAGVVYKLDSSGQEAVLYSFIRPALRASTSVAAWCSRWIHQGTRRCCTGSRAPTELIPTQA
jgi:uncharacterized repeat protein (TIGR03803 family)